MPAWAKMITDAATAAEAADLADQHRRTPVASDARLGRLRTPEALEMVATGVGTVAGTRRESAE